MKDNPWHRLPDTPPFVHPDDRDFVEEFNSRASGDRLLRTGIAPEAFVGAKDAPVVLLGNWVHRRRRTLEAGTSVRRPDAS